jgi:hypothetical protein
MIPPRDIFGIYITHEQRIFYIGEGSLNKEAVLLVL